jgi:hypothetical protein
MRKPLRTCRYIRGEQISGHQRADSSASEEKRKPNRDQQESEAQELIQKYGNSIDLAVEHMP